MRRLLKTIIAVTGAELILFSGAFTLGLLSGNWETAFNDANLALAQWGVICMILAVLLTTYAFYRSDMQYVKDLSGNANNIGKSLWSAKFQIKNPQIIQSVNQKKTRPILVTKDYYHF